MNNKNIIKTSHELNHFKGGYTRLELDFIYAFISTIKDEDERFKDYKLSLSDLEKKLGKRLELKKIEYIFDSLVTKTFKVNNAEELAVYSFFTYLHYNKVTKELTVNFNEKLKPHLIQLNTFAMGNFKYILQFKSEYSKRIYMLLSQWQTAGKKLYTVEELREILAVPKSYKYNDFKKRVLEQAEAELKTKNSDILFECHEQKKDTKSKRKVTHILFDIIKSGGTDRQKPSIEEYKNKEIYYSGEDRLILNVWEVKDEKGYLLVQMIDKSNATRTDKIHQSQIDKMIAYSENRPKLF